MTVHVVGAGIAGLAAAVQLANRGRKIVLHEATTESGGRCRSYHDQTLGMTIDNGNHLLLSGNAQALSYLALIGVQDQLVGPDEGVFDFVDLASAERWRLRPNRGRVPWWVLSPRRRVPGTTASQYVSLSQLFFAKPDTTVGASMVCAGRVFDRLWRPLLLAALNTEPAEASASLAVAVLRETLALGRQSCRPLIAANGLSRIFIDPALSLLAKRDAEVRLGHRLRAVYFSGRRATRLTFGDDIVGLGPGDQVIIAVPAWIAAEILPGLVVPTEQRAIVNGHFKIAAPPGCPMLLGIINGTVEWIFAFEDRLSVTVSAANRLLDVRRETLAEIFWRDIQAATGLAAPLPPWQIIKEKRATFAALPSENRKRPTAQTMWDNVFLAGDFTATGLPATIEGAVRSGFRGAELAIAAERSSY
jgi:squalene-associated FAD-dependent desaturase